MVWFKTFSIHVAQFRDVGEVVVPLFKQFLCAIEKTDLLFRESRHPGPPSAAGSSDNSRTQQKKAMSRMILRPKRP